MRALAGRWLPTYMRPEQNECLVNFNWYSDDCSWYTLFITLLYGRGNWRGLVNGINMDLIREQFKFSYTYNVSTTFFI